MRRRFRFLLLILVVCTVTAPFRAGASLLLLPPSAPTTNCRAYLKPHSSMTSGFDFANRFESRSSKIFRANLRAMNLDHFIMDGGTSTIGSHVTDFEIKIMQAYFDSRPESRELFDLLFRKPATREQVQEWTGRNIPGYKVAWLDDLQNLDQFADENLKTIAERAMRVQGKKSLVTPSGFIDHLFYFELIEHGYIPIMNDHDLSVHLVQFLNPDSRTTLKRLNRELIDEFLNNPALNRELAPDPTKMHKFEWMTPGESVRRVDILLAVWETMQESRIVRHPEAKAFSLMGGIFTAFAPNIIKGAASDQFFSIFRWFASFLADGSIRLSSKTNAWKSLAKAYADAGIAAVTPLEVGLAVRNFESAMASLGGNLSFRLSKRTNQSIGSYVDGYFADLNHFMDFRLDANNLVDKSPENLRQVRINEASRKILTLEKHQLDLINTVLDDLERTRLPSP